MPPTPDSRPREWTPVDAGGSRPSAREDHTWTVDASGATAYLFGGRAGGSAFDDLHAYDLVTNAWRRLEPAGPRPGPRFGHEAVWVDGLGLVVYAGQASATAFHGDLWAYNPATNGWRELPAAGDAPVPRYGTCSGIGPDGRLWISHGFTEDRARFADTRAYDFEAGRWDDETPAGRKPIERCLHGCFFTDDGRFVLYGGQTTGVAALGDLWVLEGAGTPEAAWTEPDPALPAERNLYAYARAGDQWIVVGGRGLDGLLADGFTVDATTLAVAPAELDGESPPARSGATLITDPSRGRLLLFGGLTASGESAELWQLE